MISLPISKWTCSSDISASAAAAIDFAMRKWVKGMNVIAISISILLERRFTHMI